MPIVVAPSTAPTPPGSVPPVVWTTEPVGSIQAIWIDPDGVEWPLTGPHERFGWLTRSGPGGWGANPVTIVTDPLARGGISVRHQRNEPRRMTWPLHIYADTHVEFVDRYRRLMRAITATKYRGAGFLRVIRPNGTAREIECLYEDGFGGHPGENHLYANPTVQLLCPDGFWRDVERQLVTQEYVAAGDPYLDPYPTVTSGRVLGDSTILNSGDVDTWPSWTLTGPALRLSATNVTSGQGFALTHTLAAGQQATITITPDRALVRGPAGQNLVGSLDWPGADLWALLPGVNEVNVTVDGAAPGTRVQMWFYRRYEAA